MNTRVTSVLLLLLAVCLSSASVVNAGPNDLPIYNVQKYGAVGDGKTNCTQAVQAAVRDLANQESEIGGIIYFPAGSYLLNSNPVSVDFSAFMTWNSSIAMVFRVKGDGSDKTTITFDATFGVPLLNTDSATDEDPIPFDVQGLTIQQLSQSGGEKPVAAIDVRGTQVASFTDIVVNNADIGLNARRCNGIQLQGVSFIDVGQAIAVTENTVNSVSLDTVNVYASGKTSNAYLLRGLVIQSPAYVLTVSIKYSNFQELYKGIEVNLNQPIIVPIDIRSTNFTDVLTTLSLSGSISVHIDQNIITAHDIDTNIHGISVCDTSTAGSFEPQLMLTNSQISHTFQAVSATCGFSILINNTFIDNHLAFSFQSSDLTDTTQSFALHGNTFLTKDLPQVQNYVAGYGGTNATVTNNSCDSNVKTAIRLGSCQGKCEVDANTNCSVAAGRLKSVSPRIIQD